MAAAGPPIVEHVPIRSNQNVVMAGLVPAIHGFFAH
jgi:hypothetical protein